MICPKTVLITGCSSGIGLELIKLFDSANYRVIATARGKGLETLQKSDFASSTHITLKNLNVRSYQQATSLIHWIHKTHGPIEILINNAGVSYRSAIEDMTPEEEQRQMQINYLGPLHIIREALPEMRRNKKGHIINVSSVGGMMAMPTMASYSASKFALEGASEALWYELKPWNIHVSLVRPGFINSQAFKRVAASHKRIESSSESPYNSHYENMEKFVERMMTRTPCTSENVARRIYKLTLMTNPPLRLSGTPDAKLFQSLRWLLPRRLYHALLYRLLPGIKTWGDL